MPLFALSLLWVTIYVGLTVSLLAVEKSFEEKFASLSGYDLQITSSLPLVQDDLDALDLEFSPENVSESYRIDLEIALLTGIYYTRAESISEDHNLNLIHLIEGEIPEKSGECLVSPTFLEETALVLGDSINFTTKESSLLIETAEIVGVGYAADYLSNHSFTSKLGNGTISSQIYLKQEDFKGDFSSFYLHAEDDISEMTDKLHTIGEAQWLKNSPDLLESAEKSLTDAEKMYEEAENNARNNIQQVEKEISVLETEISNAWATHDGTSNEELAEIKAMEQSYGEFLLQIQDIQEKLEENTVFFRKNYEQALRDYALIEEGRWEISTIENNLAYGNFYQDLASWKNFSRTVPTVFFWIYVVISLFIMSRMISEQRTLIGGLMGLGYKKHEILKKYFLFNVSTSFSAAILANLLAVTVISFFIHLHWENTYFLMPFHWEFYPRITLLSLVLSGFFSIFTTILPFYLQVREQPAHLMRPKSPPPGRHIMLEKNYMLWNDLKFNQKIALRTLFRHKTRLITSVLAVAVTTALIITALAVQKTYPKGAESQFQQIYRYNVEITARNQVVTEEFEGILQVLSDYSLDNAYSVAMCQSFSFPLMDENIYGEYYIFETTKSAEKVIDFRLGQFRSYYMPETGVVMPIKLADVLGLSLGDSIILENQNGDATLMVTALMEQYHKHQIYTTAEYYTWSTGENMVANKILLKLPPEILESPQIKAEFEENILSLDGTQSLIYMQSLSDNYTTSNNLLKNAMFAFFVASCILAYLVLNQLNQNSLIYRRRELATLKVLGLYDGELSAYIYRENIIYTFLGVVLGVVLGQNIYLWFVQSIETNNIMLSRSVSLDDYLRGAGMTVIFALIVNIRSHFKIKKMNMAEELKQSE